MFFLKLHFQEQNFESIAEFGAAVTEFMNMFADWFINIPTWLEAFNARKAYYFGQFGWDLDSGKKL